MSKPICCVADQHCLAAANFEPAARPSRIGRCATCGEDVCRNCSVRYRGRRDCHDCLVEMGEGRHVANHLARLSGYDEPGAGLLIMCEVLP